MIEDELWLILGIVILIAVAVLIYLIFTNPEFVNMLKEFILSFRLPKPWKS